MSDHVDPPHRTVTLVFDDPPGILGPLDVSVPWWQEAAPVVQAAQERLGVPVTILRLLHNERPFPGGAITYLAEAPDADPASFRPLDDETARLIRPDSNRAAYAEVGGPSALLEWARTSLAAIGVEPTEQAEQIRTWNLAGVWRIETTKGRVWVKATPHFLAHEWSVLSHLRGSGFVPELIAGEPGRALMFDAPGLDGYDADERTLLDAVDVLLDIQSAVDHRVLSEVPRLDEATVTERLADLAARHRETLDPPERASLDRLLDSLADRFSTAAPLGETLVHGDVHGGNLRLHADRRPIVLDWGDSFVGSPLFDVFAPESYDMPGQERIRLYWLDRLSERSGADATAAWDAFRPVAAALLPLVYQRFCDNIERAELPYHAPDVAPALRAALEHV